MLTGSWVPASGLRIPLLPHWRSHGGGRPWAPLSRYPAARPLAVRGLSHLHPPGSGSCSLSLFMLHVSGQRRIVWICSHSIVHWAGKYAASSGWGRHLGLDDRLEIRWIGSRGMLWESLAPTLIRQARREGPPDAVIIQLGENDLGRREAPELKRAMCSDLDYLRGLFPRTFFLWSDLLQRRYWRFARHPEKVDGIRQRVARAMGHYISAAGGLLIQHSDISFRMEPLFRPDGHRQNKMNQTIITNFILLGFSDHPKLQVLLFVSFLTIYLLTVAGNIIIIVLVVADIHLHTPMYLFLGNLSCLEICYTSTILPRLLFSLLTGDRTISVHGCIMQYFFFGSLASTECYLLAMMSYDRYLAICRPLRYTYLMNSRICFWLLAISWMSGLLNISIITSFLFQLLFCGPSQIEHFFCDIEPLFKLSCSSTHLVELVNFIFASIDTIPPFLLTLISYICIIINILQMKSTASRKKAFSTCSSYLIVVTLFYGSLICVYLLPETNTMKVLHKTFSLFFTVFTPMLNPLIYSLRNREIKAALYRMATKIVTVAYP
ncbi:olfactory receptor 1020-like [Eublepharis macularius]|uniref:Olfactory receptor 1020-like n=1 Tax=Eublepharis macularius TaxID=481883 RepID=A0AA97LBL2_EUBMA|nr:olfactory receptor 1020-like [Eublepharis macularius]